MLLAAFTAAIVSLLFYRTTDVRSAITQHSVTVDQLDYRSIQQVENAGFSVDYNTSFKSANNRTLPRSAAYYDAQYVDNEITPAGT